MFESGVSLVNENCADLFEYLGKARQNLTAGQRVTGLAGGVTASVLALTGVPAKTIGMVATAFTALLAGSFGPKDIDPTDPDQTGWLARLYGPIAYT